MAGVFIDIPGVGNVEAKNAATEATLREILKAMQGVQKNTAGGGGSSGGNNAGSGGAGPGGAGPGGAGAGLGLLGKAAGAAGLAAKGLGMAAGAAVGVLGKMTGGVVKVSGAAVGLSESAIGAADALSRLDGSASGVAEIFSGIPLFGKAFKAVAGAADDVIQSYTAVAQSGATFGGSISNFAMSASEAGMNMKEFGALIQKNGNAMTAFGSTTEGGASNFARVSKQLRSTSSELTALGFSTQDINQGLASYGALMKLQGQQGKKSNAELAQGAKSYLKEMDLLAKATGQSRSQIEESMAAMAKDAQFQAAMSGLGEGVRSSFLAVTTGLPKGLEGFAKDIMATGTATTEENQKLMAMMPQSAAMLQKMNAKMQRGEAVTLEERNALNNLMKQEGAKNLQNIKYAGAASAELSGTVNSLAATQQINIDGLKEASEEQKKAQAETDKMNEKMQAFQQRIAELANQFKILLATSGILDVMMQAFDGIAKLAKDYLVPAFNIVTSVVMKVANGISLLLAPVIDYLGEKFGASGLGGTVEFIDGLMNTVFESVGGAVRGAILVFDGLYDGVMSLLEPFKGLMSAVFGTGEGVGSFGDILIDVGAFVGDALRLLGTVIGGIVTFLTPAIKAVVDVFKFLWNTVSTVINFFTNLGNHLADFGDGISGIIDKILFMLPNKLGGISKEEKERRDAQRQMSKDERDAARKAQEESKTKTAEQHKAELKEDKKTFSEKKVTSDKLTAVAKKEADAKEKAVKAQEKLMDFNAGPEELLKAFSGKEGGKVELGIKKDEAVKEKSAADKEFAEAKTTAEKKAALAKVEAAEKKIENLEKAIELSKKGETATSKVNEATKKADAAPKNADAQSSKQGEATKKELEAKGEEKTAADKKTQQEAEAKKAAEEKAKESENKKQAPTQESAETLLAQLNSNMAQLVKISQEQKDIGERQLSVQRSLTGDLFASV